MEPSISNPKRSVGRPAKDDISNSRDAILEAAIFLLRESPTKKLTSTQVAAQARIDRAMINYHFGSIQGLIRASTASLMKRLQQNSLNALAKPGSLEDRLRERVRLMVTFLIKNPHFESLAWSEIYQEGSSKDLLIERSERGLALAKMVLEGDESRVDVDPKFLHIALLASSTFFVRAKPLMDLYFGPERNAESFTEEYISFITRLFIDGIRNRDSAA